MKTHNIIFGLLVIGVGLISSICFAPVEPEKGPEKKQTSITSTSTTTSTTTSSIPSGIRDAGWCKCKNNCEAKIDDKGDCYSACAYYTYGGSWDGKWVPKMETGPKKFGKSTLVEYKPSHICITYEEKLQNYLNTISNEINNFVTNNVKNTEMLKLFATSLYYSIKSIDQHPKINFASDYIAGFSLIGLKIRNLDKSSKDAGKNAYKNAKDSGKNEQEALDAKKSAESAIFAAAKPSKEEFISIEDSGIKKLEKITLYYFRPTTVLVRKMLCDTYKNLWNQATANKIDLGSIPEYSDVPKEKQDTGLLFKDIYDQLSKPEGQNLLYPTLPITKK